MAISKCKSIKSKLKNTAGETLMETMISIVLFLIVMAAITGIVKTATNLNVEARQLSQKIEQAGAQVEAGAGQTKGDGNMNILFDDSSQPVSQDIVVKFVDPFTYFEPKK